MSDRYFALTVVLEQDIRDDDAEPLIAAIRQMRGVADVASPRLGRGAADGRRRYAAPKWT